MSKELKTLQLFYAGVLADSIRHYEKGGILETVIAEKRIQQKKAAPGQLRQLGISTVEGLFNEFSKIFGCIDWKVEANNNGFKVTGDRCLLCNISKSINTVQPCSMYCINPFTSLIESIDPRYSLVVKETLWNGIKCEFSIMVDKNIHSNC